MAEAATTTTPVKRNKRGWIWIFVILVTLCVVACATIWFYNDAQQLKADQLARAEQLWCQKGPKNYELRYVKIVKGLSSSDQIHVQVKNGTVVFATRNNKFVPAEVAQRYAVDGMFQDLREFLEEKQNSSGYRTFIRAIFSATDGHPTGYIRRKMWSQERVTVEVKKFKVLD